MTSSPQSLKLDNTKHSILKNTWYLQEERGSRRIWEESSRDEDQGQPSLRSRGKLTFHKSLGTSFPQEQVIGSGRCQASRTGRSLSLPCLSFPTYRPQSAGRNNSPQSATFYFWTVCSVLSWLIAINCSEAVKYLNRKGSWMKATYIVLH